VAEHTSLVLRAEPLPPTPGPVSTTTWRTSQWRSSAYTSARCPTAPSTAAIDRPYSSVTLRRITRPPADSPTLPGADESRVRAG
jgi:hypothetical protein